MEQTPLSSMILTRSRSMGIKLLVVSVLALIITIPALFVDNIVQDRTTRGKDVIHEISGRVGGNGQASAQIHEANICVLACNGAKLPEEASPFPVTETAVASEMWRRL